MTTGRINQITILTGEASTSQGSVDSRRTPRRGPESLQVGAPTETERPARGLPGPKPPTDAPSHPIASTELPKKWSATTVEVYDAKRRPTLQHTPLSGRIPTTRHARGRLQASVVPQMSRG